MEPQLLWFAAIGGLAIGFLLGLVLARRGSRGDSARVRELEAEIASATSAHAQYRSEVSQHFGETSRRLHDLTLQYRSVYEHLADGARSLCPEGSVAIAPPLAEAALPETAGLREEIDEAQLDLALDAPERWTPEREDDLGPLLEEEPPPPSLESSRTT